MPGKMAYLRYTANSGAFFSLKTRLRNLTALNAGGGAAALGFSAFNAADPIMPRRMRPRVVYVQDPTGGSVRSLPVGSPTAPAWDNSVSTVQIDYSGVSALTDAIIIGRRDERAARVPHVITSLSDAG